LYVGGSSAVAVAIAGVIGISALAGVLFVSVRTINLDFGDVGIDLSEGDYRRLFVSLHEGFVVQGPDGRILVNNPAAERILGLSGDQLRGRTSLDPKWRAIHPDGSPFPGEEHPAAVTLRTGADCHEVLMGVQRGDDSLVWVLISTQATVLKSHPGRSVVVVFADVTRQHDAEVARQRLGVLQQAILDSANLSVIATDRDGTISLWNATATRLLQWTADEMIGLHNPGVIHVGEEVVARAAELSQELAQPIAPGFEAFVAWTRLRGIPDEREWTYVRKDGSRFPVLLSITALRDEHGQVTGYLGIGADISERRRHHAELLQAKDAAESGARAKAEFLATMSHEIRTPMNGILGMSDLLAMTALDHQQREYLDMVRGSAEGLLHLINDILDFSKIESGKLQVESLPVDPRAIAEELTIFFAAAAQAKGLELLCEFGDAIPDVIETDPVRLRQILLNLLSNAVKFTLNGEVVLTLACDGEGLVFAVSDSGVGIPPEALGRLFQPFFQADASTTRRFGGTGLGLAISHSLAGLLGGDISVESRPGQGSTFRLRLPLDSSVCSATLDRRLAGQRVLCLMPNARAGAVLVEHLRAAGAQAGHVGTLAAAVDQVQAYAAAGQAFGLVIIDCPVEQRHAVLDAIRAAAPGIHLLLIAPVAHQVSDTGLDALGISACLTKPIRRSSLLATLARILGGQAPSSRPSTPAALPAGPRILVAEDNLVNQKVIGAMLGQLGLGFQIAQDGNAALAALRTGGFAAVLMDCQMPELDGYAATQAWRGEEPAGQRIPIIALTANALSGDRERCMAAGMDDYLAKPIRLPALREMFSRHLPSWGKPSAD
jgi:PAS domain S-box-containing protein